MYAALSMKLLQQCVHYTTPSLIPTLCERKWILDDYSGLQSMFVDKIEANNILLKSALFYAFYFKMHAFSTMVI
jgi:hypothetical protein